MTRVRQIALILLVLLAVFFLTEIRLDEGRGSKRVARPGVPGR